jgi:LmbE family N-acetylglucosaminyl deacetylase
MSLFRRFAARGSTDSVAAVPSDGSVAPHLHVCAHTDDDLYFMSPDLLHTVRAGIPVVSVYLTTGEADGLNYAMDDPARKTATPDYAGYTAARQHGIRAAYAAMATGDRRAEWVRSTLPVRDGGTAEVSTLALPGRGPITLVFLNLRTCVALPDQRLLHLWSEKITELGALSPSGSPLPAELRPLTRDGLIGTLADLLGTYAPAVVRVMNPDPARASYDKATDSVSYCDNSDHTAAAFFALAALRRYENESPAHRPAVESYSGYCNKLLPNNLSADALAEKFRYLAVYGGEDGHACREEPGACGDRPLGNRAYNRYYGQSTTHRWSPGTDWLHLRGDGRLAAFGVLGGRPVTWTQNAPGGTEWDGPQPLGTWPVEDVEGRCLPRIEVVRDGKGLLHAFALRAALGPSGDDHRREVVHAQQSRKDGEFGGWENLGSPHEAHNADRRRALGMPVAVVTSSGRPMVVVRNFGTGLSARNASADGWGGWRDLAGGSLDGAAAITLRRGVTEVYATTGTSMLRWHQARPGAPLTRDYGTQLHRPAARVALLEQTDGRLVMVSRQPNTGWLLATRQHEAGGTWNTQPELLDTTPGFGPVAAAVHPGKGSVVLVQRRDDGTLTYSQQPLDGGEFGGKWVPFGSGPVMHQPAVAFDAQGRATVAVLDAQARLRSYVLGI